MKKGSAALERLLNQTIAWQGVTMQTPSAWSLVAVSGDESSGSMRVERTGEGDADSPAGMEVRWGAVKQAQTAASLDKRIKPLLDTPRKAARRAGGDAEAQVAGYDDNRHPERGAVREFYWRTGSNAGVGRIWRCAACGRLLIAQVYCRAGSRAKERAREVLASLECHNRENNWTRWALYGLDVLVPADYALSGQQLQNIYLELRFQRKGWRGLPDKQGDLLTVEQWSAANVQLKGAYLDEWFERKGQALQRELTLDKSETVLHGHPALRLEGARSGAAFWLLETPKALVNLHRPLRYFAAAGWECPETNKVYLVQHLFARRGAEDIAGQVAERIRCHSSGALGGEG